MSHSRTVDLGDGLRGRVQSGHGPSVLWIHGYTLDSSIWHELWSYLPEAEHIGVDLPGHGESQPRDGEDLAAVASRIARLAERCGARHVAALSFGGLIALEVAARIAEPLESLILSSPQVPGAPLDGAAQTRNLELMSLFRERGAGRWLGELWMRSPPDIFAGAAKVPALWERLREVVERHPWTELDSQALRWIASASGATQVPSVRAGRVQVFVGEDDMPVFKRGAEILKRKVPNVRRSYVPHAGHLAILECPAAAAVQIAATIAPP